MKLNWIAYRLQGLLRKKLGVDYKKSYSQCGEDLIIRHIFDALRLPNPSYLDIGAHHPSFLSNTKIFYENGSHGVNVEPDPSLFEVFNKERPKDINLNYGVAKDKSVLPFYILSLRTLNTFSEVDAKLASQGGKIKIEKIVKIPVVSINEVIKENFSFCPDFLSLDIEGLDLTILQSLDFSSYRPKVICVETITFSENRKGTKITAIEELMRANDYFSYADTNINTLYVDQRIW